MKGIHIKQFNLVHEDNRRKLLEFVNGEIAGKSIKMIEVKEDSFLGGTSGHWHQYSECMVILKGKCWDYVMENVDTKEKETFEFKEGDIVFRTGRIIHGGMFEKGSLVLDIATETYLSGGYNDIPREDTK